MKTGPRDTNSLKLPPISSLTTRILDMSSRKKQALHKTNTIQLFLCIHKVYAKTKRTMSTVLNLHPTTTTSNTGDEHVFATSFSCHYFPGTKQHANGATMSQRQSTTLKHPTLSRVGPFAVSSRRLSTVLERLSKQKPPSSPCFSIWYTVTQRVVIQVVLSVRGHAQCEPPVFTTSDRARQRFEGKTFQESKRLAPWKKDHSHNPQLSPATPPTNMLHPRVEPTGTIHFSHNDKVQNMYLGN